MNPLDTFLLGLISLFILLGKYDGLYTQFNRLISILISVSASTLMINSLVPFFIPYIGISKYTRFMTFYFSLAIFYLVAKFIVNLILFKYEPSQKNIKVQSFFGMLIGGINGFVTLSLILAIMNFNLGLSEQILLQLNNSIIFSYLNKFTLFLNVQ